jgi:hypothetical protein
VHAMFTQRLRVVGQFPSLFTYRGDVTRHEAKPRRIGEARWDVVCPGCPGHDAQVCAVPGCPDFTCREQAQLLADFHAQLYSEAGDRILR